MRHLAYGRTFLDRSNSIVPFVTGNRETGLVFLTGQARVTVNEKSVELGKHDAIYIPRDSSVSVETGSNVDIAEFSSDVAGRYPLQIVRSAEVSKDPSLNFGTGDATSTRHLYMLLAKNIQAGRLIVGFTVAEPGNWTSWPPHEHAAMLEEIYVYVDMPAPAYGVQLVYNNAEDPELVTMVREGDAVLIPGGYHPNVSVPGHRICFLWAMAAHREVEDRQFGVVNIQPGFDQVSSGLEAGRKS